jgi:Cof subfamily protein (haloacid dehalogenase superfamily)
MTSDDSSPHTDARPSRAPVNGGPAGPSRTTRGQFALAAVDVDDTLLGPDWRISAENTAAVRALLRRGVCVVLASGRNHVNMRRFHDELGLGDGPVISCQGAIVRLARLEAPWVERTMVAELVRQVTREGLERGLSVQHYRGDEIRVQGRSAWTDYDQTRNDVPHVLVDDLLADGAEGVAKIIWLGDPADVGPLAADRAAAFRGTLTVTPTDAPYLEFYDARVSKATALAAVAQRLGVRQAEVLAFGDGNNDAPMLAWAGLGVAMDHAKPAARAAAGLIAPAGDARASLARAIDLVLDGRTSLSAEP